MPAAQNITTGDRFGRLTAMDTTKFKPGTRFLLRECRCDCGNLRFVSIYSLLCGKTRSCGCMKTEIGDRSRIHGRCRTRIYRIWSSMMTRCTNPKSINYPRYGGRGITVCERWHKFENFLADMGDPAPHLSIDRIDNDGPYCKENCAWRTSSEQALNRRPRKKIINV